MYGIPQVIQIKQNALIQDHHPLTYELLYLMQLHYTSGNIMLFLNLKNPRANKRDVTAHIKFIRE